MKKVINITEPKNNKPSVIPVFFATDDNYTPFLCVAIGSIIKHISKNNQYKIYVLNTGLTQENLNKINSLSRDNFEINCVNVEDKVKDFASRMHTRDYYSKSTYYRIFIPSLFPQYDKALYLDSDIVVLTDIANLYKINIGNNLLGAAPEEFSQLTPEIYNYVENFLGLERIKYFNAGILIMNLSQMRKQNLENKFLDMLVSIEFKVAQDQDYLNVICKDKVKYLSFAWNKSPHDKTHPVDLKNLNIIHYTLTLKPWHYDHVLYQEPFWESAKEIGLEQEILKIKNSYTIEQKQKDQECEKNLKELALKQSKLGSTFHKFSRNIEAIV